MNENTRGILIIVTGLLVGILSDIQNGFSQPDSDSYSLSPEHIYEDTLYAKNRYYNSLTAFNGHHDNPLELLRGRLPGLLVSRPGSDPNRQFDVHLRGFNTLLNNEQPLYVVDGVPEISLSLVDPNDIVSMEIIKGASATRWGIRGSRGIIRVQTRPAHSGRPSVRFRSYIAAEQPGRSYDVLNSTSYILQQEKIYGSYSPPSPEDNNWTDVITRTALSTVNNLSLSGGTSALHYRAALNLRKIEGIALSTGYSKINGRIRVGSKLFEDRLEVGLNLSASSNRSQIGFSEAFQYAVSFNPSAPRETNDPQFGGYYQQPVYDYYNPLAVLEQNQHDGNNRLAAGSFTGTYRFDQNLSLHLLLSESREELFRGEFYPADSFFRGYDSNGYGRTETDIKTNRMGDIRFNWKTSLHEKLALEADVGYSIQNLNHSYVLKEARNLPEADSYNIVKNANLTDLDGNWDVEEGDHLLTAIYGYTRISDSGMWYIDLGLRYEGSSFLGSNNKQGLFPYLTAGYDIENLLNLQFADYWMIRGGYGVTGNVPRTSGWSKAVFEQRGYYYSDGEYLPSYSQVQSKNPDLKWESTRMLNAGFDFTAAGKRIRSSVDFFHHQSTNLIVYASLPVPPYLAPRGYLNMGGMTNRGVELSLQFDAIRRKDISYTTGLNFSTIRTTYNSLSNEIYSLDGTSTGYPGAGGCGCSNLFIRINENEPAGQFYGPVFEGIDENGNWILTNESNPRNIGNGLPNSFLGWSHSVGYRNWEVDLLIRGVFGHDLISVTRMLYESPSLGRYNILESTPENLDDYNTWNSYYVEDGDYIKLDNLTFSYRLPLGEDGRLKGARFFVSADNLLTLTGYSGADPSVRFTDQKSLSQYSILAPGIDRPSTWLDSRTFMAGVNLRF